MSSNKPDGEKDSRERTIHLPSVDPDCYLAAHSLELGKYEDCGTFNELSEPENWGDLRKIVQPVADLVVKDVLGQHFVDDVRHRFDSTRYQNMDGKVPFICRVMSWGDADGDAEVLKVLLAVGLDPDLPDTSDQFRPSHLCGAWGRKDFAELIFPCRPSMLAVSETSLTPLSAASSEYVEDMEYPQRKILRKKVKTYIEAGRFEDEFPSLAELVAEESWFAVKNLLRRKVVAESEFTEKLEGKTAAEWAEFLKEPGVAEEIRYYGAAPSTRQDVTAKQMTALVKKLFDTEDERSVLSSNFMRLEKNVEEMRDEKAINVIKIKELSETVVVLRKRLKKAGIGFENEDSSKSDPEEPVSNVDLDSDVECDVGTSSSSNSMTTTDE